MLFTNITLSFFHIFQNAFEAIFKVLSYDSFLFFRKLRMNLMLCLSTIFIFLGRTFAEITITIATESPTLTIVMSEANCCTTIRFAAKLASKDNLLFLFRI